MNHAFSASITLAAATLAAAAGCSFQKYEDPDVMPAGIEPVDDVSLGVLSEEPWSFGTNGGRIMRTEHFRIYTTERTPQLREQLARFLEISLTSYMEAAIPLPAPKEKLDVYLMDTRPQWQQLTQKLMGERAQSLALIQRGGFAARGIGVYYDLGMRDTLGIAAHEGWHQFVQKTFAEPLPIWLDEGMATYFEGFRTYGSTYGFSPWANLERYDQLRTQARVEDGLYGLPELLTIRPADLLGGSEEAILAYYAEVWALTHFLREANNGAYLGAFQSMIRDAQQGRLRDRLIEAYGPVRANAALASRTGSDVFAAYVGVPPGELDNEFRTFVRRITQPGTRDFIVVGKSPVTGL